MIYTNSEHPAGLVGIISDDLTRYPQFWLCLERLQIPVGTAFTHVAGKDIACNRNVVVRQFMESDLGWTFWLDDDHTFDGDLLIKLLDRNVDIVQPLCSTRKPPFFMYAMEEKLEGGYRPLDWNDIGEGLVECAAVGTGGMLARRSVYEKVASPWFESGKTAPDSLGEDYHFCSKARDLGFKVFIDSETRMGHIGVHEVWPNRVNGEWCIDLDLGCGVISRHQYAFGRTGVREIT